MLHSFKATLTLRKVSPEGRDRMKKVAVTVSSRTSDDRTCLCYLSVPNFADLIQRPKGAEGGEEEEEGLAAPPHKGPGREDELEPIRCLFVSVSVG